DLASLASEAWAQYNAMRSLAGHATPLVPTEEVDLIDFMRHAAEVVNGMRERRAADMARARYAEAEMLDALAEKQMIELQALIADRRRAAFVAGDKDAIAEVNEALGQVVGAINDAKVAARLITSKAKLMNDAANLVTQK